jgi:predicted peptidase
MFKLVLAVMMVYSATSAQANEFLKRNYYAKSGLVLPYRLFVPVNYSKTKSYPVILALHGAGAKGNDNVAQLNESQIATLWAMDSIQAKHPAFILSPQCPTESTWVYKARPVDSGPLRGASVAVLALLDSLTREFSLDSNRIYLIGQSMGGHATWEFIERFPNRFAAAIPICGVGDTSKASLLKALPIWTFQGDQDSTVPVAYTRNMVAAIRLAGGKPKYTEYAGVGHDAQIPALKEPLLPEWLFAQKKAGATTAVYSGRKPSADNAVFPGIRFRADGKRTAMPAGLTPAKGRDRKNGVLFH